MWKGFRSITTNKVFQSWRYIKTMKWNYYNKYKSHKTNANGVIFDSKKEYNRYIELTLLSRSGAIKGLKRQVKFELIPAQYEPDIINPRGKVKKGKLIERAVSYIADFVYTDENGKTVVEDTKGFRTKDYIIKRKLLLYMHGIRIKEI